MMKAISGADLAMPTDGKKKTAWSEIGGMKDTHKESENAEGERK